MDKTILRLALEKCYIIIAKFTAKGEEYVHATLDPNIIKYITDRDVAVPAIISEDTVHTIYDLKNEKWIEYKIDDISQILYPGLPFEISPNYIINPEQADRVSKDEVFGHQVNDLAQLKVLKTYQKDNNIENNFIPNALLQNIKLINASNTLKEMFLAGNKNVLEKDSLSNNICYQNIPSIKFIDKYYLEAIFSQNIDKNLAVINYKYLSQLKKLVELLKVNNLDLDNLDDVSSKNLEKYKKLWEKLIKECCDNLISELTQDIDKFKSEFPELSSDQDEVKFVIKTLKNTSKEIDFKLFNTPRSLFSFWPPILYPSPEYVLDMVYLKNEY